MDDRSVYQNDSKDTEKAIGENGGNGVGNAGEIRVLVPESKPKTGGKWVPGQSGNPSGRPSALRSAFKAIADTIAPTDLGQYFKWGIEKAKQQNSPRVVLQYLEFYVYMQDGTPVKRSINASTKLESILTRLGEMDEAEFAEVEQQMRSE